MKKKQKTKKSITRRFRITKKGKVMRRQAFRRHLKVSKGKKRLRRLKSMKVTRKVQAKKIKRAVGK